MMKYTYVSGEGAVITRWSLRLSNKTTEVDFRIPFSPSPQAFSVTRTVFVRCAADTLRWHEVHSDAKGFIPTLQSNRAGAAALRRHKSCG